VVGLAGGFGTVLLGRQTDFADTISAYTSVNDFGGVTSNSGSGLNRLQGVRTNNSISYTTNNLSGFTGNLIYGFGEQAGKTSAGQAFGIGGKYDNGPLGLGINYYQSKQGQPPSAPPAADRQRATQRWQHRSEEPERCGFLPVRPGPRVR
jgi:predicted porin